MFYSLKSKLRSEKNSIRLKSKYGIMFWGSDSSVCNRCMYCFKLLKNIV